MQGASDCMMLASGSTFEFGELSRQFKNTDYLNIGVCTHIMQNSNDCMMLAFGFTFEFGELAQQIKNADYLDIGVCVCVCVCVVKSPSIHIGVSARLTTACH